MKTFILDLTAEEVVHLLRAETESAYGQPELDTGAEKDYVIEENFDRGAYGIRDGEEFDLARSEAILTIEPRVEMGYWILEADVERALGPVRISEEDKLVRQDLTLDEFENELHAPGQKQVIVRLYAQTPEARRDFDRWLTDMRTRHPWNPTALQSGVAAPMTQHAGPDSSEAERTSAREAVGVFADPATLETAVDELEVSGFDRAAISVLGTDKEAKEQIARFYRTIKEVADSERAPRRAFVSRDSRTEGEAAVVGIPLYMGGLAGAAAVAAAGGALAFAVAATLIGGIAGASLGAIMATAIARRHSAQIQDRLEKGGLILWVSVANPDAEKRALVILEKMGARDVHVHVIERVRIASELPRSLMQADPFLLENDRY
jgi:outer membrane lipoprotein SlyB